MRRRMRAVLVLSLALLALSHGAPAQEVDLERRLLELERRIELLERRLAGRDSTTVAELRRQIEAITQEIEDLRLGQDVTVPADSGVYGFGPAASKVYRVGEGVSLGGYGEMLYEGFAAEREDGQPSGRTDQIDFLRAIVYVGYKFDDRILFNSELEFEHASTDQAGSVSVEFAYLDYRMSSVLGVRAGLVLLPMGFINEGHEPPTFLGSQRPETEQRIIPTTWRENGLGLFGEAGGFAYRAYLVNGFDAVGGGSAQAAGFSAAGLRGGRQKGSKAVAEDIAIVARVDYVGTLALQVGTSLYAGNAGQGAESPVDSSRIDARTLIWEGHAQFRVRGLDLRGLFSVAMVSEVQRINDAKGLTGDESVGERLLGGYLRAGYDVLHGSPTTHQLIPYVGYEWLNTQDSVPEGFAIDPANEAQIILLGAAWKPMTNLVLKADYQIRSTQSETGVDQFNVALGYLF